MCFFSAQSAIGAVTCGNAKPASTMNGERVGIIEVAAAMMIIGTLASVATGAVASASGVSPNPARMLIWSCTTISWAMRLVTSGAPVSSLTVNSTLRPATLSPLRAMYSLHAASTCLPVDANGPVRGRIRPIFNGSAANASCGTDARPPPQQLQSALDGAYSRISGACSSSLLCVIICRSATVGRIETVVSLPR